MDYIYLYLVTVPVFFAIDMVWIAGVANKFYQSQIGMYLKPSPNWPAAISFYLLYIAGILFFAVIPNLDAGPGRTFAYGAIFGLMAYATYDLTNYSTIKDWPLAITIVDLCWGTVLTGTVALVSYLLAKSLLKM